MLVAAICLALSLLLLLYPFAIYPLVLRLLPRAGRPSVGTVAPGRFAVLLSVRDEEADLPRTLGALRELKGLWPDLEILVWEDGSTDATPALLDAEAGWLRLWHSELPVGKAAGMARLMARTQAYIVIMLDANIRVAPADLLKFRDVFADPSVGAVGGRCLPTGDAGSRLGRLYWSLEETIKAEETRSGSTMGCDGGLWAIRRALYPAIDPAASDDFLPSMEALLRGYRVISDPGISYAEAAVPDSRAPGRAWRIGCGAWHAHRAIWPRLRQAGGIDRFKYVSHKLIRWFAALWLAAAAVSAMWLAVGLGVLPEALTLLALAALPGAAGVPPFRCLLRFFAVFVATTGGVLHAMRGGRVERWAPIRAT